MSDKKTPFEILGITAEATPQDVRTAFREKAKTMHPDHGGDPLAFHELRIAFDEAKGILLDKRCRPCKGTGRVHHTGSSWGATSLNCPDCRGTGKKFKKG